MKKLRFMLIVSMMLVCIISLNAQTVYVSRNGTGNYNCDGVKDQVQINQALAYMGGQVAE